MKKKIYLLITFIVSLFLFSSRVDAAKELTCVYEGEFEYTTMLVQDSEGNRYFFAANDLEENITSIEYPGWKTTSEFSDVEVIFSYESSFYDKDNDLLTACPEWTSGYVMGDKTVVFYDESRNWFGWNEHSLRDDLTCDCLPSIVSGKSENQEEIDNTQWIANCAYSDSTGEVVNIYFNSNKVLVDNERKHVLSSTVDFTGTDLYNYYVDSNFCPSSIYEYYYWSSNDLSSVYNVTYYMQKPDGIFNVLYPNVLVGEVSYYYEDRLNQLTLSHDNSEIFQEQEEDPPLELNNCGDLLGPELVEKINQIMNIVKIAVPILLIAFGVVDFTKAVFSGSEDDMKKSQKAFVRRILAAVLVFIAPIFINLILEIANEVWDFVSPNTCIK